MKYIELICYKQVLLWQEENVESLSSLLPVKSLIKEHGHEGADMQLRGKRREKRLNSYINLK